MNGTRKGHLKLTPNVRYALSEGDGLVVADVPCQYVSCTVDSSEGDTTASVGKHSGANAESPDGSGEEGSDTSTGSKRCVNGDTEAGVLLSDQEDSGKTSVLTSCLSFEQTPTHPQGTLVPESDSDSDDSRGDGRRKALGMEKFKIFTEMKAFFLSQVMHVFFGVFSVSNSDFHESGPVCSTFLSPTNKIVPERYNSNHYIIIFLFF